MASQASRYLAVALSLILVLTGQSMAVARGSTGPVGQVTLCTGTGPVMVYVDENGVPTGPPVLCPEFALNLLAAVALPDVTVQRAPVRPLLALPAATVPDGIRPLRRAHARAPPRPV